MKYAIIENNIVKNVARANEPLDSNWILIEDQIVNIGYTYNNGSFIEPEPEPITKEQVITERSKRLQTGFNYDFGDERGTHLIQTTDQDMIGWDEVTKWAQSKVALNKLTDTKTILTGTGIANITSVEWFEIIEAADAFRGPIWQASFNLQVMDPIPLDYTNDSYWL